MWQNKRIMRQDFLASQDRQIKRWFVRCGAIWTGKSGRKALYEWPVDKTLHELLSRSWTSCSFMTILHRPKAIFAAIVCCVIALLKSNASGPSYLFFFQICNMVVIVLYLESRVNVLDFMDQISFSTTNPINLKRRVCDLTSVYKHVRLNLCWRYFFPLKITSSCFPPKFVINQIYVI